MNEEEKKAVEILNTFEFRSKTRNYKKISLEDSKSVKIVLNLLEKLQKENEELKEIYISEKKMKNEYVKLYQDLLLKENVIPVQKVKDEIAELKGKLKDISKRREKSKTKEEKAVLWCLEIRTDERIKTLQELL